MSTDSYGHNVMKPNDCCGVSGKVKSHNNPEIYPDTLQDRTSNRKPSPYPLFIGIEAAAMSFSSVSVIGKALRLRRGKL